MNTNDGTIRSLPPLEQPGPYEVGITEAERKALEHYRAEYRPELLARWRDGRLKLGPRGTLVDAAQAYTRQQRRQIAREEAKKLRAGSFRPRQRQ